MRMGLQARASVFSDFRLFRFSCFSRLMELDARSSDHAPEETPVTRVLVAHAEHAKARTVAIELKDAVQLPLKKCLAEPFLLAPLLLRIQSHAP